LTFESGSKLSSLGPMAFWRCSSLQSLSIPSPIRTVFKSCFGHCSSLSSVTFEPGCNIKTLEASAFEDCSSLQSISIPASLRPMIAACFRGVTDPPVLTIGNYQCDI
jgi:hypothetical protein